MTEETTVCCSAVCFIILTLGCLAVTVLSVIVLVDYDTKTYYVPVECFNCENPVVTEYSLYYAGNLNCTYLYDGQEKTASIRYPGNAPWAFHVSKSEATSWATYNNGNNFTCYLEDPETSSNGYQVLIVPLVWYIVFGVFGLSTVLAPRSRSN